MVLMIGAPILDLVGSCQRVGAGDQAVDVPLRLEARVVAKWHEPVGERRDLRAHAGAVEDPASVYVRDDQRRRGQ
jgi:hypothetical protein